MGGHRSVKEGEGERRGEGEQGEEGKKNMTRGRERIGSDVLKDYEMRG